ncbi:MAG: bifunctional phosphoribosyl-AMP cyclohydrolase/phosphoribosyl-ATP diphosphatase HisIE [Candidatus Marinimicrobia bacterium]|nr:bifunctional phosphoribosyl-AMP cyclohydrolase/phosphoribosyl-ATP diphosphatase HisIE [FCB group bacterium]MBL7023881.1 bifunctional phosphoribosyl-AMP cyclohydrolase/phosphoribosyl-ATP diphosphatase HisIE [Candidatus Neomarinimicrobiota bacterium]
MKVTRENLDQLAWDKQQGLIPAIIQDAITGVLLMQAYMNQEALIKTLETGRVTFFSRTRQCLWEKGETSGNTLHFKEIVSDCDGDSLMVLATPTGPVCHTGAATCWEEGPQPGLTFLSELEGVIAYRQTTPSETSYTAKLLKRGPKFIAQKVGEEAVETALAAVAGDDQEFLDESADLIYHLLVLIKSRGLTLNDVVSVLKARHD